MSTSLSKPVSFRVAFSCLVFGASAIGFAPIFVRLSPVGPSATGFWRLGLAAPIFLIGALLERRPVAEKTPQISSMFLRLGILLPGLFFAGDMLLWNWSISFTTISNATLLTNLAPIVVTFAAWWLFNERFTPMFLVGLAVALGGTVILMGKSFELNPKYFRGDLLALSSAFFYGGYQLAINRMRKYYSTTVLMVTGCVIGVVVIYAVMLLRHERLLFNDNLVQGWLILLGLALFSHAGGQGAIVYALAHLPAAFSSISLLVQPIVATIAAWILLHETLAPLQLLGGAVIIAGIYLARLGTDIGHLREIDI